MKLPSGEKVSPAIRVRCCLEGGKGERAENQKKATEKGSSIKCNAVKNPGEQNKWGQAGNPSTSTPTAAQGCCWMGPAPPALEHPTSHTEAHERSLFMQSLGEPLSYHQQLSEGAQSTRCCCRLDLHHPQAMSDQLAHENCQAPRKQPSHLRSYERSSCHNTQHH